jgi:hypothetical protein
MKVCLRCGEEFANWELLQNHHVRQWEQCLDIAVERRLATVRDSAEQRMDEMEASDLNPDEGHIEVGLFKKDK